LIRNGHRTNPKVTGRVFACGLCGIWRLDEEFCVPDSFYQSGEYRKLVNQALVEPSAFAAQDDLAVHIACAFNAIGGLANLRGASVVDIGCGVGSLLDIFSNIASTTVGIEPCRPYHPFLEGREHVVFNDIEAAKYAFSDSFDWGFSIQVIEHVADPVSFLSGISELLNKDSRLVLTTPNRDDLLVKLVPEYEEFFFRTQHRWYFDADSLTHCASKAGFATDSIHFTHKYPIGNFINWLKDREPTGMAKIEGLDQHTESLWRLILKSSQLSDTLVAVLRKS
jgi:2-polyprenyl-3-methyl-5-hydroxy-6-metoxy-1,4-benzoquinol methylase